MTMTPEPRRAAWTVRMLQAISERGAVPRSELIAIGSVVVPPGRGWRQTERKRHSLAPRTSEAPIEVLVLRGQRSIAMESLHQLIRLGTVQTVEHQGHQWITKGTGRVWRNGS